jgi:hypothetical protein
MAADPQRPLDAGRRALPAPARRSPRFCPRSTTWSSKGSPMAARCRTRHSWSTCRRSRRSRTTSAEPAGAARRHRAPNCAARPAAARDPHRRAHRRHHPAGAHSAAQAPPHILVTTPESLYVLLGSDSGRRMLSTTRTVIVDEIHALAGSKRGSHLALSPRAARRAVRPAFAAHRPVRDAKADRRGRAVSGGRASVDSAEPADCAIVDVGYVRAARSRAGNSARAARSRDGQRSLGARVRTGSRN